MRYYYFFLIIVILLVGLTGCGDKECETSSDCVTNECFTAVCIDGSCKKSPINDCCGNGIKEDDENSCTCPEDYGSCESKETDNKYTVYGCVDDECVLQPKDLSNKRQSLDLSERNFDVILNFEYPNPFSVKEDVFDIKVELKKVEDGRHKLEYIKLKKIEIYGEEGREETLLGEKSISRKLWLQGDSFKDSIYVSSDLNSDAVEFDKLGVKITYEYMDDDDESPSVSTEEESIRDDIALFVKDEQVECNVDECDDGNPATKDEGCYPGTSICMHEPIPNECGNYKCDYGETKCNCPDDCGRCERVNGEYTRFVCDGDQCLVATIRNLKQQTQTFRDSEEIRSVGKFNIRTSVKQPFNQKADKVNLQVEMSEKDDSLINSADIVQIEVVDGSTLLGSKDLSGASFDSVGSKRQFSIPVDYYADEYEEQKSIQVILHFAYSYNTRGDDVKVVNDDEVSVRLNEKLEFIKPEV